MTKNTPCAPFRKVLIPVDFSPHAEQAMEHGSMISKKFHARITVLHVIESLPYSVTDSLKLVEHRRALETIAKALLDNLRKIMRARKVPVGTVLTSGAPYREILRVAEREKADLIVMGTHGRTGLEHLVLGSVAEKVVRLSRCPVLTVPLSPPNVPRRSSHRRG